MSMIGNIFAYFEAIYKFPFIKSLWIMLVIFIVYFLGYFLLPGKKAKMNKWRIIAVLLFSFYVSQVISITLLNRVSTQEIQIDLDLFTAYQIAIEGNSVFMTQILGNIIMFVPFGFFVPICFRNLDKIVVIFFLSFSASLTIEVIQLYTCTGIFELGDLLNNTLGGMIGYVVYKIITFIENILKK